MRRIIVSVVVLLLSCGSARAQGGSATTPTLKVSDGQKSFNGVNELRVPPGCVTFSGRMAVINCTAGASTGTATSQNGNLFYASPDGSYGLPSWRTIVEADLPGLSAAKTSSGTFATARLGSGTASSGTYLRGDQTWAALPAAAVSSVFGRAGAVVAATNDYTWAQINKTTSSLADLTTRSASDLSSGTLPDARFPATLPALSGANLTALNASNLSSGTAPTARLGSGTASSSTYLRGDQTWAALPASGASLPYLLYTALLTQSGTNAPVATVLQNTLGGTVVWARTSAGVYTATLTGAFTANKTAIVVGRSYTAGDGFAMFQTNRIDANLITFVTSDVDVTVPSSTSSDGMLNETFIEIRVYP